MPIVNDNLVTEADLITGYCTICNKPIRDLVDFMHPECRMKRLREITGPLGWDVKQKKIKFPKVEPNSVWMEKYLKKHPEAKKQGYIPQGDVHLYSEAREMDIFKKNNKGKSLKEIKQELKLQKDIREREAAEPEEEE